MRLTLLSGMQGAWLFFFLAWFVIGDQKMLQPIIATGGHDNRINASGNSLVVQEWAGLPACTLFRR
jgi:hypothetical protein